MNESGCGQSDGGGSLSNLYLSSGAPPSSPDSSPTAREPDHAIRDQIEKIQSRMNSFEELAWDEKQGTCAHMQS